MYRYVAIRKSVLESAEIVGIYLSAEPAGTIYPKGFPLYAEKVAVTHESWK